ncbi:hypothetical protein JL101_036430 (plasmid) [Skermanella rosea]|uniref:hypothetical protein n=1 Tax=Skermanella rosea TaxID=1817965 RepID=UPI0019341506|nr:hypothetical protein [Skermanella rosea]UEM08231.1 hypothetical protein JL101_036430 [Skermanella rosea]
MNLENRITELETQNAALHQKVVEGERKAAKLEAENKQLKGENAQERAGRRLAEIASAAGVLPSAVPDAVARALEAGSWKEMKGKLVRIGADGHPEIGPGGSDITPDRAMKSLKSSAPHLFADADADGTSSAASAARPSSSSASSIPEKYRGNKNPWRSGNMTQQAEVYRTSPALAQRLADEAGVPMIPGNRPPPHGHMGLRR